MRGKIMSKSEIMRCGNCKKSILLDEGETYYVHEGSKFCYDCYIQTQMETTIESIISPKIRKMITGALFSAIGSIFAMLALAANAIIVLMPDFLLRYAPNLIAALPVPLFYPLVSYNLITIAGGGIFVFLGMIGMAWSIISARRGAEFLIISSIGGTLCLGLIFALAAFWYVLAAVLGHPDMTKIIPAFLTKTED